MTPLLDINRKKLKVINLFGAPGRGKSGTRSGLFWLMKACQFSVEEVSEYAKYLVMTGRTWQLQEEQLYLLSKQHHKQLIIERNGYEYAATDSPLQLSAFYAPKNYLSHFEPLVAEAFDRFENINFFLTRDVEVEGSAFEERGRMHDRASSVQVEQEMREFLDKKSIVCTDMAVDLFTPFRILERIAPGRAPWPTFAPVRPCTAAA